MAVRIPEQLKPYKAIADGIHEFLGSNFEVVLHDLSVPEHSLVYIAGNVTKREVGGPVTNVVLEVVRNDLVKRTERLHYTMKTNDGNEVKSMTIFIRDKSDTIIGCMCILGDFTPAKMMIKWLEDIAYIEAGDSEEFYARDVNDILDKMIADAVDEAPLPVHLMTKEEKVGVVKNLDQKGLFLIKGAVDKLGQALHVSRYTIYNYIDEIRY